MSDRELLRWFGSLTSADVAIVGGKNASLGEMVQTLRPAGIQVPDGFATTADAYRLFLAENDLEEPLAELLGRFEAGQAEVSQVGAEARRRIEAGELPSALKAEILAAYRELAAGSSTADLAVAVRSSATAEDLPDASFAGQQESFLNVRGEDALLDTVRRCFASLFTDRAIVYRREKGFEHLAVALSVGVQRMVRSDLGAAGVAFTIDPESGFPEVVEISGSWGLGESVVQGTVIPDRFEVFKPCLDQPDKCPILRRDLGAKATKRIYCETSGGGIEEVATPIDERQRLVLGDDEVLRLARWSVAIEQHYGRPMDIEWAKDGETGEIFIVQARPETVQARRVQNLLRTYRLEAEGECLVSGASVGAGIASGPVCKVIDPSEIDRVPKGAVLVTRMTDPDWVPIMREVAAIVTDEGGRTCHAAIVSRELGIPAVVGTGDGTQRLEQGAEVTVSCAGGLTGRVYAGRLPFEVQDLDLSTIPTTRTEIMTNLADPDRAFLGWQLPADGVGLARMEFIITQHIGIHPMALVSPHEIEAAEIRAEIERRTRGSADPAEFFVDRLSEGIARLCASRYPRPVIVRTSDFKTNEYAGLFGGEYFESDEANPMIGFRGASRYLSPRYRPAFVLECRALARVRQVVGLDNLVVMIPFCRTLGEADGVLEFMAENGLARGVDGLEIYVMCEIPSNVILAEEFSERFDGFSIGSNDLTQLVLGVDRDSAELAHLFDETDPAVTAMIRQVIATAHRCGRKVGLCGQAPSDRPEFAAFLVEAGIDSISVLPDSLVAVKQHVAEAEQRLAAQSS